MRLPQLPPDASRAEAGHSKSSSEEATQNRHLCREARTSYRLWQRLSRLLELLEDPQVRPLPQALGELQRTGGAGIRALFAHKAHGLLACVLLVCKQMGRGPVDAGLAGGIPPSVHALSIAWATDVAPHPFMLAAPPPLLVFPGHRRPFVAVIVRHLGRCVLRRGHSRIRGAGVEDAGLPLVPAKARALSLRCGLDRGAAILKRGRCHPLHDPSWCCRAVLEEALPGWDRASHTAAAHCSQAIISLVAIEVSTPTILGVTELRRLDDHVAVVRAHEHVDAEVWCQTEEVRGKQALGPADGVPALAVVLLRVHRVELCGQDVVAEAGRVGVQDWPAIVEYLEALVALLWTNVCDNERVALDQRAPERHAHGRAGRGEALGVAKAAVDAQLRRLDQVIHARCDDGRRGSVDAVERQDVRVPEDGALPKHLRLCPHDLGDEPRAARLALAGVDVLLAIALGLEGYAFGLVGEHDCLAIGGASTRPAALVQRDVVERIARAYSHRTRKDDRPRSSVPKAREAASHDVIGKPDGSGGGGGAKSGGGRRGGNGGRILAGDFLVLAAPLLLGRCPSGLPVVDARLAIDVARSGRWRGWRGGIGGRAGRNGWLITSHTLVLATIFYLGRRPCGLPVIQANLAIELARRGRCSV
mmetsp:Transcript_132437/g.369198  ORF Transcript_132437/g.369198 Transcript_132437/m.369198 type:complete len:645 (-) Transcript_132437:436-2370(-)